MNTRKFKLSDEQASALEMAQMSSKAGSTALRYQAVRLYGLGYAVKTIEAICGCHRPSLMEWCAKYQKCGIAGLVDQRQGGNRARLSPAMLEAIQSLLHQYKPSQLLGQAASGSHGEFWSLATLACLVEQKYGIRYQSATSYRRLFEQCDFSYQRPSQQYHARAEFKVMAFEEALEKNC